MEETTGARLPRFIGGRKEFDKPTMAKQIWVDKKAIGEAAPRSSWSGSINASTRI
jgi:hypothetical protein